MNTRSRNGRAEGGGASVMNNSGPGEAEKWIIAERESQFGRPERCDEQRARKRARGVMNNPGSPRARKRQRGQKSEL